jgi:hypothetical protein
MENCLWFRDCRRLFLFYFHFHLLSSSLIDSLFFSSSPVLSFSYFSTFLLPSLSPSSPFPSPCLALFLGNWKCSESREGNSKLTISPLLLFLSPLPLLPPSHYSSSFRTHSLQQPFTEFYMFLTSTPQIQQRKIKLIALVFRLLLLLFLLLLNSSLPLLIPSLLMSVV